VVTGLWTRRSASGLRLCGADNGPRNDPKSSACTHDRQPTRRQPTGSNRPRHVVALVGRKDATKLSLMNGRLAIGTLPFSDGLRQHFCRRLNCYIMPGRFQSAAVPENKTPITSSPVPVYGVFVFYWKSSRIPVTQDM